MTSWRTHRSPWSCATVLVRSCMPFVSGAVASPRNFTQHSIAHISEDELIPYILHPNVSASENLTDFNLLGQTATGSHAEAALYVCLLFVDTVMLSLLLTYLLFRIGSAQVLLLSNAHSVYYFQHGAVCVRTSPARHMRILPHDGSSTHRVCSHSYVCCIQ